MRPFDILLALGIVIIWGANFVVIRIGLQDLPPILFTALRFLFAALPLVFFIRRPAVSWRLLAAYAMFQFALQFTLLFYGMHLGLPPGLASLVVQLQGFFTIGLAVLILHERPSIAQLAGAAIALCGMLMVAANLEAKATLLGFLLVLGAGLCWGAANIVTKHIGAINPLGLVAWGSLIATPVLLLASLLIEGPDSWEGAASRLSWKMAAAVLFQSYPNTLLGFGIWAFLMRRYPAAIIAPFTLLVPVTGMLSSVLILGEPLQWWKMVAGLLVLTGLALNQFGAYLPFRRRHAA